MTLPTPIKLDAATAGKLRKLSERNQSVQSAAQLLSRQFENRMQELQVEGREIWKALAAQYKIDVERIAWDLDKDGETIVPIQMRLRP
jgi:hypothetical protein